MRTRSLIRFLKYSLIGGLTFAFDLTLLFLLIDVLSFNYIVASGIAFTIAISINYVFSRRYVFKGSARSIHAGYINFLLIASAGLLFVMGGMYVLVGVFGLPYLVSRVGVAGITGFWNYLLNLYANFKVARKH